MTWELLFSQFSSVAQLCLTLRPCGLQHAKFPCPSPAPGACSNSCPLSQWCHPTISSSVIPFSSHLQCFPASGSFPVSQFFASDGQGIGVSASASVLPMNIQDLISLRIDWLDLLVVQGTPKSLLQHHSSKAPILWCSAFFIVQLWHPYMTTGKTRLCQLPLLSWHDHMIFFSLTHWWMDYINFQMLNKPSITERNLTWLWCIILIKDCQISFANTFLRNFFMCVHKRY